MHLQGYAQAVREAERDFSGIPLLFGHPTIYLVILWDNSDYSFSDFENF